MVIVMCMIRINYKLTEEKGVETNITIKTTTDPTEITKLKPTQIGMKNQQKPQLFNQQDQQPFNQQEYQHKQQNNTDPLTIEKLTGC